MDMSTAEIAHIRDPYKLRNVFTQFAVATLAGR